MSKQLPLSLISIVGLIWVISKSITQPLVFDEVTTVITFLPEGCGFPWIESAIHSNNHLGLTFLLKLYSTPTDSEWSFRLVSILSFIPYCWGVWKLFSLKSSLFRTLLLIGFLNPFFLEFFSLARGYAPFLAFFIWLIVYLQKFNTERNLRDAYVILLLGWLATSFYEGAVIPIGIILLFVILLTSSIRDKILLTIISGIAFAPYLYWGYLLREANQLYFGASDPMRIFSSISAHFATYSTGMFTLLMVICILPITFSLTRRTSNVFQSIFIVYVIAIAAQFIVLDTPLPQQRTAIPLLILLIISALINSKLNWSVVVIMATISIVNLPYISLHEAHIEEWRLQQVPREYSSAVINFPEKSSVGGYRFANITHMYNTYRLTKKAYLYEIVEPYNSNFIITRRSEKLDSNLYAVHQQLEWSSLTLWKKIDIEQGPTVTIDKNEVDVSMSPHILMLCDKSKYVRGIQSIVGLDSLSISLGEEWNHCQNSISSNYSYQWREGNQETQILNSGE